MDWIEQTLRDFVASKGLDLQEFDTDGGFEIILDNDEWLGVACFPDLPFQEIMVYTSRPLQFDSSRQIEAALRLSNAHYNLCGPVQTSIQNRRLIMALRLSDHGFNLPALNQAVDLLLEIQRKASDA